LGIRVRCSYPLMLDLTDRLVVIVGGGAVAARKAKGLLDAGATRVRVISPAFCDQMPAGIEHVEQEYDPQHLSGATLVFAATDQPEVNQRVVRDAHRLGLLVNRADADDDEPGDFTTPAILRDGGLLVTVSAGGSPALTAAIRDRIKEQVQPKWVRMAAAMQELRPRILAGGAAIDQRRAAFRDLASDEAMDVLERRGPDELWTWLQARNKGI
jgi:precorrin-2 dehydrogenase/sirohydrochlorin ferrochelatase